MGRSVSTEDGCRLWTARAGGRSDEAGGRSDEAGEPLVLCHGGPGLWDMFGAVAELLAPLRTIRWDQRGCGRSQRRGPYAVGRCVADLDAVRRDLSVPRVALLGHSWGATLALWYALTHPDAVSALVYVSGTGIDEEETWRDEFGRRSREQLGAHGYLARWEALRARDRTPEEDREFAVLQWSAEFADHTALRRAREMAQPWFGINHECNAAIVAEVRQALSENSIVERCRRLTVPVLILDGDRDIRPRAAVDSLHRALPDVRRVTLPGVGHMPWMEEPDGFRAAVAGFLAAAG